MVLDEVILEIEAQYERFVELTGRQPQYFEGHAVSSKNFFKGLEIVANRHGLKYNGMAPGSEPMMVGNTMVYMWMDSMNPDYDPEKLLKDMVMHAHDGAADVMVCHPGYLDGYILKHSSLTIPRTMEVDMACDPAIKQWLKEQDVMQITYEDL